MGLLINPDKPRIDESDLALIDLSFGGHDNRSIGLCANEAAAWLAGEPHSSSPLCVACTLCELISGSNDALSHRARQRLKEILPNILNTNTARTDTDYTLEAYGLHGAVAREFARALIAVDCAVREIAPLWFDDRHYAFDAASYRALASLTSPKAATEARELARRNTNPFADRLCQLIYEAGNDACVRRDPLTLIYGALGIIRHVIHGVGSARVAEIILECIRRMCAA